MSGLGETDLAACGQIHTPELTLGHIVRVEIGPAQDRTGEDQWIELIGEVDRLSLFVSVHAGFERRLRIAEQVVDNTETRREIVPDRHRDLVEGSLRNEPSGRRRRGGYL
jgi:hypothetical protein